MKIGYYQRSAKFSELSIGIYIPNFTFDFEFT